MTYGCALRIEFNHDIWLAGCRQLIGIQSFKMMDNLARETALYQGSPSHFGLRNKARSRWRETLILALVTVLVACMAGPQEGIQKSTQGYYVVHSGENLSTIAWRYGLDYQDVARWNALGPPYLLYPGQKLRLNPPVSERASNTVRPAAVSMPAQVASIPSRSPIQVEPVQVKPDVVTPQSVARSPRAAPIVSPSKGWQWPLQGEIITAFSTSDPAKKGIDIAGEPGMPVMAAAPGKVVYSGSGLLGYGQLIIIKHDQGYLSAYAYNRRLLVKEGEQVKAGQHIAEVGNTGTQRPMLHFEIRQGGKPVDPLDYLPQRSPHDS